MAQKKQSEIRIVTEGMIEVHQDLVNIAKNSGVTLQQFLRPKLREISDSYPAKMKLPPSKD